MGNEKKEPVKNSEKQKEITGYGFVVYDEKGDCIATSGNNVFYNTLEEVKQQLKAAWRIDTNKCCVVVYKCTGINPRTKIVCEENHQTTTVIKTEYPTYKIKSVIDYQVSDHSGICSVECGRICLDKVASILFNEHYNLLNLYNEISRQKMLSYGDINIQPRRLLRKLHGIMMVMGILDEKYFLLSDFTINSNRDYKDRYVEPIKIIGTQDGACIGNNKYYLGQLDDSTTSALEKINPKSSQKVKTKYPKKW